MQAMTPKAPRQPSAVKAGRSIEPAVAWANVTPAALFALAAQI